MKVANVDGMADHTTRIAEIQDILRTGARSVNVDGVSITYDFVQLRNELRQLMSEDDTHKGRRPIASRLDLSRAFGS